MVNEQEYNFTVGGTLKPNDPSYVKRRADDELYQALKKGEYCNLFNSRQMGKSSLETRVRNQLKKENFAVCLIDVSNLSKDIPQNKFYYTLIEKIMSGFKINQEFDLDSWFDSHDRIDYSELFRKFIEDVLFSKLKNKIIISIDEIDSFLSLDISTDDFFAFIRQCQNKRANNPEYNRLTFCLLGVAAPSDLIRDRTKTPYNIGQGIKLTGFTFEEAKQGLLQGLTNKVNNSEEVLKSILQWTEGQPFLTQKICKLVSDEQNTNTNVNQLVKEKIINNWEYNDKPEHLNYIRQRLLKDEKLAMQMLNIYKRILQEEVIVDNSYEQTQLQLSGLVVNRKGKLNVYNKIYREVFNEPWVESQLEKLRPVWYREKKMAWLESEGKDVSCLLYGWQLKYVFEKGFNNSPEDEEFVWRSRTKHDDSLTKLTDNFSNKNSLIDAVIGWTKYQQKLFSKLIDIINTTPNHPASGAEDEWVEDLVKGQLIENWQKIEILKEINEKIKEKDEKQRFWLLVTYGKILEQGKVESSGSSEEQQLLDIGLVVKRPHYLKIANRIYENVFNQRYIEDMLPNIREYWGKLALWLIHNNDKYLLSPEELESTLKSLEDQNLELEEHQFLIKSRILN